MNLSNSEIFKKEVNNFKSRIEKIDDEKIRKDLLQMLGKLIHEVNYIDHQHRELEIIHRLPETINSSRTTVSNYRKKLNDTLASWEKHTQKKVT